MSAAVIQAPHEAMPLSKTGGGFARYLTLLCEAYAEAMQQTQETRRNYPFVDV